MELGFSVKWEKAAGPSQRIVYFGITINSKLQRSELPLEKLRYLTDLAKSIRGRQKVTKRELQVLVGHMSLAAKAVYGARTFARLFVNQLSKLSHPSHKLSLPFCSKMNSTGGFISSWFNGLASCNMGRFRKEVTVSTDATFSGFGAVFGRSWLAGTWIPSKPPLGFSRNFLPAPFLKAILSRFINFLELLAACMALIVWSPEFPGKIVTVLSNNTQTVSFLNRGTTKNPEALHWLKLIFAASHANDFRVIAQYCPEVGNISADSLSRLTENSLFEKRSSENFREDFPGPALPVYCRCSYPVYQADQATQLASSNRSSAGNHENSPFSMAQVLGILQKE